MNLNHICHLVFVVFQLMIYTNLTRCIHKLRIQKMNGYTIRNRNRKMIEQYRSLSVHGVAKVKTTPVNYRHSAPMEISKMIIRNCYNFFFTYIYIF